MSRNTPSTYRRAVIRRRAPTTTVVLAIIAGFAATGVSAGTLAQPGDTSLERTAADYVRFRKDVAEIEKNPFKDASVTREAHRKLASHDSHELSAGWVAYAALVAADTPEFANAIKKQVKSARRGKLKGADAFLSELAQDPSYPRTLKGADDAISAVLAMTVSDSARIIALGEAYKSQAYAMQKTKWGKARIDAGGKRVSDAASFSQSRPSPAVPGLSPSEDGGVIAPSLASVSADWDAGWGEAAGAGSASEHNADVIIDRVLNLAARYSVGKLNQKIVSVYAKNDRSERCLSMAKLTLDQCIAATRSPYEEAFCLGEHGLKDIATCTGWVAGAGAS